MADPVATGLFTLAGVILGALLTPLTQVFLERKRDQRMADKAKGLVALELIHNQLILRAASRGKNWPLAEDSAAARELLPSSAWEENRASVVGQVNEDLLNQLEMAYATVAADRVRFVTATKLLDSPLEPKQAEELKKLADDLGKFRRELGGGGGFLDEFKDEPELGVNS